MKRVVNGLIVIDKPSGITSRDAVNRLQERFPRRTKIGHTGTLDPLATGVLVVCLGSATRLADYVQGMDKTYRAKLTLGARSDTDDADGTLVPTLGADFCDETAVRAALTQFLGEIEQTPPAYSAVKIAGQRAHDLARRGREVDITPRNVKIYTIDVLGYRWPELDLEIACGKGTYIRSLARDLGAKLGCGAYVQALRRTRVGSFTTEMSVSLEDSATTIECKLLLPRAALAHLPVFVPDTAAIIKLRHGNAIAAPPGFTSQAGAELALIDDQGALVGVGCPDGKGSILPVKIIAADG